MRVSCDTPLRIGSGSGCTRGRQKKIRVSDARDKKKDPRQRSIFGLARERDEEDKNDKDGSKTETKTSTDDDDFMLTGTFVATMVLTLYPNDGDKGKTASWRRRATHMKRLEPGPLSTAPRRISWLDSPARELMRLRWCQQDLTTTEDTVVAQDKEEKSVKKTHSKQTVGAERTDKRKVRKQSPPSEEKERDPDPVRPCLLGTGLVVALVARI